MTYKRSNHEKTYHCAGVGGGGVGMKIFKRIKNEGIRRVFVLLSSGYMMSTVSFLFIKVFNMQSELFSYQIMHGLSKDMPPLFNSLGDFFIFMVVITLYQLAIPAGYALILSIQWAYDGFKNNV